jgi:WW domain-containing oxidoreductase
LVNNAGLVSVTKQLTKDGFEMTFGVNHLGHFLLTELLREKIKQSAPSRIVIVSSNGQGQFLSEKGMDFDNLNGEKNFNPMEVYSQSKLANTYHSKELQRQFDQENADVTVTSLHPGFVITNIGNDKMSLKNLYDFVTHVRWSKLTWDPPKPMGVGASTSVYCAISPDVVKGEYYADNATHTKGLNEQSNNVEAMKKLWDISAKYVSDGHP